MWIKLLTNKYVMAGLGFILLVGVLYGYFRFQESKIDSLQNEVTGLKGSLILKETQINGLESAIDEIDSVIAKNSALAESLAKKQVEAQDRITKQLQVLEGDRLEKIATKKSSLLERKVNQATIRVFEQIELETKEFGAR